MSDPLDLINSIDWDAFLRAAQQFPSLRRIVIQYNDMGVFSKPGPDELLVVFVAHLVGAWAGLGNLLEIYSGQFLDVGGESQHVRIELQEILAANKQKVSPHFCRAHVSPFFSPPNVTSPTITAYRNRRRRRVPRMGLKQTTSP